MGHKPWDRPWKRREKAKAKRAWKAEAKIDLLIHLDEVDGEPVWWADSPQLPGFNAAAPTLAELRSMCWHHIVAERLDNLHTQVGFRIATHS